MPPIPPVATATADVDRIRALFRPYQDFPKKNVLFQDIFPVFQDPVAVEALITHFVHHLNSTHVGKIDVIVGLESRGFLLGPLIAMRIGAAFVPVRKPGKLPGQCISAAYTKEYGTDVFEMQEGSIKAGQKVVIVDDLIATGGSAVAAIELVRKCKAEVVKCLFVVELPGLKCVEKLNAPVYSMLQF